MKSAADPIVAGMPDAITRTAIMANWVTSTRACKRGHKCPDGIARGSA
jgi:hypothetical protein